jgi:hypothetical protein
MRLDHKTMVAITALTVEKPYICDFVVRNQLISLHAKFAKMPKLDFFDNLAMDRNWLNLYDIKRISQLIILS